MTMTSVSSQQPQTMLETLEMLKGILMEAREKVGDLDALTVTLTKLVELVGEGLPQLAGIAATPEEKAQMVQLREQIDELERLLQTRESILAGFSLYLKEMVEG
jgi:C4-dicarboxylate-specific signal transduction histidine kinase